MLRKISLLLLLFVALSTRSQNNTSEIFSGEFQHGNFLTDLTIEIDRGKDSDQIFFSSPEQNAYRIPAREIFVQRDSVKFVLQSDFYRYAFEGTINGDSLNLHLNVENADYPFSLTRNSTIDHNSIRSRDVQFQSGNLSLYGTVYLPQTPNGKAIYLLTSSGDQDRSGSSAEAQFFAKQGYMTMHVDKRGTGLSEGNWQESSIPELCTDDMRAITYLAEAYGLDFNSIGIKGSSQGASKVPYILSKMPELGFGMLISCPGSTLLESDLNYWKNSTRASLTENDLDLAENLQRSVFLYMAGEKSEKELTEELEASKNKTWRSHVWVPDLDSVKIDRKLSYTPIPYLQQLKQPILVIQGSSDEIIPVNSLTKIKDLTEKNNSKNNYVLLQNADHAMMYQGKSDFPYWPSLHPGYRNTMIKWLDQF